MITISEPRYLLFYSADCKYTAVIRQRLEMPHFSIVPKIFTTQQLTCGKSVLRLFDILGIHGKLENYGFQCLISTSDTLTKLILKNTIMKNCCQPPWRSHTGEPENYGFHKRNFDYLRFQVYQTINGAKVNYEWLISTSDNECCKIQ